MIQRKTLNDLLSFEKNYYKVPSTLRRIKRSASIVLPILSVGLATTLAAQTPAASTTAMQPTIKDGVSCETSMVPMRDGTKLYTEIYRSVSNADSSVRLPVIVTRSPYARAFGEGCFSRAGLQDLSKKGYVGIYQSSRGTGSSEGTFRTLFQERDDGSDLIAWAAKQPWSNGKVGMTGGSYLGATQWQPALASPANLVAIAPYITPIDYRDNWFGVNGAFDPFIKNWSQQFIAEHVIHKMRREGASPEQISEAIKPLSQTLPPGMPSNAKPDFSAPLSTPPNDLAREALAFQWEVYRHPEFDNYWRQIDGLTNIDKVMVPALIVGGWYDIFPKGTIDSYIAMKQHAGTPLARRGTMLVMDCCGHGLGAPAQPGQVSWGDNKALYNDYRDRFMEHYLKGVDNGIDREPSVQITVLVPPDTGTKGDNFVFKAADFPIPGTRYVKYHLSSGGKANTRDGDGKLAGSASSGAPDSFNYDPNDPVPSRGGTHGGTFGAMDQADVVKRPDVLVYTAAPVTQQQAIIGKVSASFWASTDGTDTDFTAILVDVHPDGLSHAIVERIVRGRFREGRNRPAKLLKPNVPYKYDLELGYTATILKPGHRLQLLISSSSYPGYERNLNTGASNEDTAETRVAHNTILHDARHPSFVTIPVVAGVELPQLTH